MIDTSWRIEDPDPEDFPTGGAATGFVSLHFIRSALYRRWKVWVAAALVGMMLGLAWTIAVPSKSHGSVTILLAHDPAMDPTIAMSTDVSLLRTRTVANDVIDELGLPLTPEAFQASVTATPVTPTVLVIDVAAPDDATAVARATALSHAYLDFRGKQMESQSQALVEGYQHRVTLLKQQEDDLTAKYNALSAGGAADQGEAADVLTQRAGVIGEISRAQQLMEDAELQSQSLVAASHVLDPPSIVPQSALKRLVLATGSGLIGGLAIGMGIVLFQALTSGRLRRRDEVALALGAPVRFSAGKVDDRRVAWWPPTKRRTSPEQELPILVHGLKTATATSRGRQARLALLAVDDVEDAGLIVAALGARLAGEGKKVFLVDLSRAGRLESEVTKALDGPLESPDGPVELVVYRPEGEPTLARGPVKAAANETTELPASDPRRPAFNAADVVLTLAEVRPGTGVDHLTSWVDRAVLLVEAGRSSAERLRTTSELVRSAGLQLLFAMMIGTDRTDESSGRRDDPDSGWTGAGKA